MTKQWTNKEKEQAENILDELRDMYHDISPDEEYIEEDEGLQEEIITIDTMLNNTEVDLHQKIERLIRFNYEWFPDGLSSTEQDEYRAVLQKAEALLQKS